MYLPKGKLSKLFSCDNTCNGQKMTGNVCYDVVVVAVV